MDSRWTRPLHALALGVAIACSQGADRPVVEIEATEGLDPDVVALVRRHAANARLKPDDAQLRANLALAFEANELWNEGVRAWADALALDPDQPVWRYHESLCLQEHGDAPAALARLRQVVEESPDFPAARNRLGNVLLDAEELDGAQREFEAANRLVDYAPEPYIGLAEVALRRGDAQRAVELCRRALELDPEARKAHYDLGLAYRALGRVEEAATELNKGLEARRRDLSDPLTEQLESYREGYTVRFTQAAVLKKAGNARAAAPIFEQLLRRHPNDLKVLNNLAGCYIELGRLEPALPLLLKAREVDPAQFVTYLHLARLELTRKNYPAALEHADKAVELAPSLGSAHSIRASVLLASERLDEAYRDLKTAVGLDASSGYDFGRLGDVSLRLGRAREAVGYYETSARLLPDSVPAHAGLAKAYARAGERDKALAAFTRARTLAPNDRSVQALGEELGFPGR